MLTVDQIKNISFKKASIGGYRCEEVDVFIDEVTATVEELKKKNAEIIGRSELLVQKVEELRSNQDSVSFVLVKSQKEADKTVKDAKKQAAQILKDARAEADKIIADANKRIITEKEMIVQITEEAAEIRQKLIEEFERQIESLKILPEKDEAEKLQKSLDEKYPTESYGKGAEKAKQEPDEEEGFDTIEEAVEDATAATEDSANAEAAAAPEETEIADEAEDPDNEDEDDDQDDDEEEAEDENEDEEADEEEDSKSTKSNKIKIDKKKFENRFGKLKFGEDYDVKKDE